MEAVGPALSKAFQSARDIKYTFGKVEWVVQEYSFSEVYYLRATIYYGVSIVIEG